MERKSKNEFKVGNSRQADFLFTVNVDLFFCSEFLDKVESPRPTELKFYNEEKQKL